MKTEATPYHNRPTTTSAPFSFGFFIEAFTSMCIESNPTIVGLVAAARLAPKQYLRPLLPIQMTRKPETSKTSSSMMSRIKWWTFWIDPGNTEMTPMVCALTFTWPQLESQYTWCGESVTKIWQDNVTVITLGCCFRSTWSWLILNSTRRSRPLPQSRNDRWRLAASLMTVPPSSHPNATSV